MWAQKNSSIQVEFPDQTVKGNVGKHANTIAGLSTYQHNKFVAGLEQNINTPVTHELELCRLEH